MENFRAVTAVPCYMGAVISSFSLIVKIIMVISIGLYVTDKGEHTVPYKINNSVYIKTSKNDKLYSCNIVFLVLTHALMCVSMCTHTYACMHTRTHARTHACTHALGNMLQ